MRHRDLILLFALVGVQLGVVWAFDYLPAQDAPAHLNNANVIRHLWLGDVPVFAEFYGLNLRPNPNWLGHLILALLEFAVRPVVAQKLLVSGYLLLLPLAARYALRAISPVAGGLAVLVVPFSMNYLFHKGFYNFCYSLPMFFFVVGFYWKHRDGFGGRRTVAFGGLSLLLYFAHPLTLMLAYVAVGVLGASQVWADRRAGRPVLLRSRVVLPLVALAPTLVMLTLFLSREPGSPGMANGVAQKAFILADLDVLYTFRLSERYLSGAMALTFAATAAALLWHKWRTRAWVAADALMVVAGLFAIATLLMPNATAGGSWITHRLALFPYFALLLFFAVTPLPRLGRLWLQFAGATIAVCFAALHAAGIAAYQPYVRDFLSVGSHVAPRSTLLPVILSETGSGPVNRAGTRTALLARHNLKPFVQLGGLIAAERDLVDLSNYEARLDYFPTRFRAGASFDDATYVLVWQTYGGDGEAKRLPDLSAYEKVYMSPRGFATLYRRR